MLGYERVYTSIWSRYPWSSNRSARSCHRRAPVPTRTDSPEKSQATFVHPSEIDLDEFGLDAQEGKEGAPGTNAWTERKIVASWLASPKQIHPGTYHFEDVAQLTIPATHLF
jgi:hypothetical protein